MSSENSTRKAMLDEKCPRCRQGNLFKTSAYKLSKFYKMNERCGVCNQTFEPEPGFYVGAMFVSYALVVALSIISFLSLYFTFRPPFATYLIVIMVLNVLLLPFIFRYSRILFLFGFGGIRFNKSFQNKNL
jgi:uncharacterized protein (DUF983 family)